MWTSVCVLVTEMHAWLSPSVAFAYGRVLCPYQLLCMSVIAVSAPPYIPTHTQVLWCMTLVVLLMVVAVVLGLLMMPPHLVCCWCGRSRACGTCRQVCRICLGV